MFKVSFADSTLAYGALLVEDHGDYADVIEVTDLDGATGTRGMCLIEQGSVMVPYKFAEARKRLAAALDGWPRLTGMTREAARMMAWSALWQYGYADKETVAILVEPGATGKQDGWVATHTSNQTNRSIKRFLKRQGYEIKWEGN